MSICSPVPKNPPQQKGANYSHRHCKYNACIHKRSFSRRDTLRKGKTPNASSLTGVEECNSATFIYQ
jgi:hypothetical protein